MRFVGGHVSIAGGLNNAIKNTLSIGGNCLQIFAGSPRLWYRKEFADEEANNFLVSLQKNNLGPVFIHALYLVNLASPNPDLVEKSIISVVKDMQNGAKINSSGVILHLGSHLGAGFEAVKDQVVSSLQAILSDTKNCDLILENDAGQNGKIGSFEELASLLDTLDNPRLKICLDTAHMFASGVDLRDPVEVYNLVKKLEQLDLLSKVVCIHLNDSASKLDSHRDVHANIGEGEIGNTGLGNIINHPSLSHLPLILEVPGKNKTGPDSDNISRVISIVE